MPSSWQILQAVRVNAIMQALQDVRTLPGELTFLSRTPITPALDGEIMARFIGRVQIADIISDDAAAGAYTSGKMTFETYNVPNIKHGATLTQEQVNQLLTIQQGGGITANQGLFADFETRLVDNLLLGIRQRMEAMIIAMHLDSFSYDRLGIKMSGVTWGMPSDLNITPSTAWTDATNATPVTDILTQKRYAQVRYGIVYDRMIMSLSAFLYMIATAEFIAKARMFLAPNVSYVNLPTQNTEYMRNLASNILEVAEIELYDWRVWSQDSTGVIAQVPLLPINKVLLESRSNDNNASIMDFANGITTESVVNSMFGGNVVGRLGGPSRGPISYATVDGDLNPPNITYWGVARGFPRKHLLQANSVLTVGSFSDTIPTTDPF